MRSHPGLLLRMTTPTLHLLIHGTSVRRSFRRMLTPLSTTSFDLLILSQVRPRSADGEPKQTTATATFLFRIAPSLTFYHRMSLFKPCQKVFLRLWLMRRM